MAPRFNLAGGPPEVGEFLELHGWGRSQCVLLGQTSPSAALQKKKKNPHPRRSEIKICRGGLINLVMDMGPSPPSSIAVSNPA
jgi:hypothetical protein